MGAISPASSARTLLPPPASPRTLPPSPPTPFSAPDLLVLLLRRGLEVGLHRRELRAGRRGRRLQDHGLHGLQHDGLGGLARLLLWLGRLSLLRLRGHGHHGDGGHGLDRLC